VLQNIAVILHIRDYYVHAYQATVQ